MPDFVKQPRLGEAIRRFRCRKALSQAALADKADLQLLTLRRIETGKTLKPHHETVQKIAEVLGVEPEELISSEDDGTSAAYCKPAISGSEATPNRRALALSADDWDVAESNLLGSLLSGGSEPISAEAVNRMVHEWLIIPPPQAVELRSGRRINEATIVKVERRTVQLRHLDDFVGGRDLLVLVQRELTLTGRLLREAVYSEALGRRLFVAIGELCQLAGWVAADAGANAQASQYFGMGIKAAHVAGDHPLAANLISTLAYHLTNTGDVSDGILFAQTAISGIGDRASATAQALFHERAAWAYACAGQARQAGKALAAVERAYASHNADEDPEWVYWLNEDEIEVMAARCLVKLNEPKEAIERLSKVIDTYDPIKIRELALYTSWLSEAHILTRNIDEAAHYANQAAELALQTTSTRSDDRVRSLVGKLSPFAKSVTVKDFLARAQTLG